MKTKIMTTVAIGMLGVGTLAPMSAVHAADGTTSKSVVSANVIPGELSLTRPTDIDLGEITIKNENVIAPQPTSTTVHNFTGSAGWTLSVQDYQYSSHATNWVLTLGKDADSPALTSSDMTVQSSTDNKLETPVTGYVGMKFMETPRLGANQTILAWTLAGSTAKNAE